MVIRELFARFGLKFEGRGAKQFSKSVNDQIAGLRKLGGALAAVAGASALGGFVKEQIAAADAIAKTSDKLGVSTDALQEYRHAAELTGVNARTFDVALQRLTRRLDDAKRGAGPAADAFRRLGIDPKTIQSNEQALEVIADGLARTEDQSQRVALSFAFFDSEGVALTNTLQGGSEALKAMRQEARDLGGVMDKDLIAGSVGLTDDLLRLEKGFQGVKNEVLRALLPTVDRAVNFMRRLSVGFRQLQQNTKLVEAVFLTLGAAATVFAAQLILPLLPIIAAIGVLFLIIEDLIVLFSGGESAIGKFLDAMFGAGTAKQLVEDLKFAWDQIPGAIEALIGWVKQLGADIAEISDFVLTTLAAWWVAFEDLWTRLSGALNAFWDDWWNFWGGLGDGVAAFVNAAVDTWDSFVDAIVSFPDTMAKAWDRFVDLARGAFRDLVSNVPDFLKRGAQVLGLEIDTQTTAPPRQRRTPRPTRVRQDPPRRVAQRPGAPGAAQGRPRTPPRNRAVAAPGTTGRAPASQIPAPVVHVPAMAGGGGTVNQSNTTTINVDASRAGSPRQVAQEVEAAVRRVNEADRRAALQALTQQGG